jgi:hypothetical protein
LSQDQPQEDVGGRPPHKPTDESRRRVSIGAGGGMTHAEIAVALGIAKNTLEKHYEAELSEGAYLRRLEALEAMHGAAVKGNVTAQRAYLERMPQLVLPPMPTPAEDPKPQQKLGKKELAQAEAKTAAKGTIWDGILPGPSQVQ